MIEYLKVLRIDHWLKNIFILFGHGVALVLLPSVTFGFDFVWKAALSLLPACLIASANYILNEILDAPFDRLHPTKKHRAVAAGEVSIPILWAIMAALIVAGFALAALFFNWAYTLALAALLVSGLVYNIPPVRLKDRAYLDVIAESFNNPIRLWLGWYAVAAPETFPPLSILLAWWFFGALLMTGKRYAEFRFIGCQETSARYRKSFGVYRDRTLIIAMITYANLFCFCTGVALAAYSRLHNLVFVFPLILLAIVAYFHHAMKEETAELEPEKLMRNPLIIAATAVTVITTILLLNTDADLTVVLKLLRLRGG